MSESVVEINQEEILEDLLAEEVLIEYKGDRVTVEDIFSSFKMNREGVVK